VSIVEKLDPAVFSLLNGSYFHCVDHLVSFGVMGKDFSFQEGRKKS